MVISEREIHVIGIQRTGQHAVTSWLIGHFDHVIYKNNMSQLGYRRKRVGIQKPFLEFNTTGKNWVEIDELKKCDALILGTEFTIFDIGINPEINKQKQRIIKSYNLKKFSEKEDYLLVIRNPYNQYASILNWTFNKLLYPYDNFSTMWKKMARECLGHTNNFQNKTIINYDKWFIDIEERIEIENKLSLKRDDSRLNTVMKIGYKNAWGSSFDGMKKSDNAQNMDVLNRWKNSASHENFKQLCNDQELKELANEFNWSIQL